MSMQAAKTNIQSEAITLTQALRQAFFNNIPSSQFMKEYKMLTEQDKTDFIEMFKKEGLNVVRGGLTAPTLEKSPLMLPNKDADAPNYNADEPTEITPKVDSGYKLGEEHPAVAAA